MIAYEISRNQTAQPLLFLMVDSADHITGKTGLTPTVTISKNGGAFASPAGAVSEVGNGFYKVAGNATDSNTLGPLALHASSAGADPTDTIFPVVAYDPQGNLTAILANGVVHGGSTASLRLGSTSSTPAFYATNSAGPAAKFEATGGNNAGLHCQGFGQGSGAVLAGGSGAGGGIGLECDGGGSGANAVGFYAAGNGGGAQFLAGTAGAGLYLIGTGGNADLILGGSTTIQGSLTGSVGSVATGGITAASFAASAITSTVLATDCITSAQVATSAVAEITVAVVDQVLSGHTTAGTVGGALNSASSAGDPWTTALPGAYTSGTAGNILGNRLDAAVSSRAATGAAMNLAVGAITNASFTVPAESGPPAGIVGYLDWMFARLNGHRVRESAAALEVYNGVGSVWTTCAYTVIAGVTDVGAAT